jgi:hypothetical protein
VRFSAAIVLATSCYRPHPQPGEPCTSTDQCARPLVCSPASGTCETTAVDAAIDAGPDHVTVAPGWTVRVLADLTGVVPYRADDYTDGTNEVLDNAPIATAALYPPFTGDLAIAFGRALVEYTDGAAPVVHDYRPAAPDMTGPDELSHLVFGTSADRGASLWIAASSQLNGDGVYVASPTWTLTRDSANNNGNGIAFDPTGAFDAVGKPSVYFIDQTGIRLRAPSQASTLVFTQAGGIGHLAVAAGAMFAVRDLAAGGTELDRIVTSTHVREPVATSADFRVLESGAAGDGTIATIRDQRALVVFAADGTPTVEVTLAEPDWVFVAGSLVKAPNRFAGDFVVLESNRAADRDRLLLVAPAK